MPIQSIFCKKCNKKTAHAEELDGTFLSVWHCLYCGYENRPSGNSMVPASGPKEDKPNSGIDPNFKEDKEEEKLGYTHINGLR